MRPDLAAFLAAVVLPLAACGGGGGSGAAQDEWAGPPRPDDGGALDVGEFNGYLDENAESASAPVVAATRFLRLDRATTAGTTSIVSNVSAEGSGPATVTVTLDRLLDDSVRAQRVVLVLSRNSDGEWRLDSARSATRCQAGRGHQEFSPELCS